MRQKIQILFFLLLTLVTSAHAALELELTQGIDKALPIAVIPFGGQQGLTDAQQPSSVITHDLKTSGRFRTLPNSSQHIPQNAKQVDYGYWRSRQVDNLIVGHIKPLDNNRSEVTFELLSTVGQSKILLAKQFKIDNKNMRQLAHHISDIIFQQLTGDRGVFSTKIAYVLKQHATKARTKYTLEVADVDGYKPQPLLVSYQPIMSPAWSHDGQRIAYVSFEGEKAQVFVVNVVTGQRQLVSSFPGINGAPAWSPNDKQLAIALSKSGSPNIYVITIANKQIKQLTRSNAINTEPSWAPDGRSIVFTSDRGGAPQIYRVQLASSKISRVTYQGRYNARASYTPDGKELVVLHRDRGNYTIGLHDLRSGQLVALTNTDDAESPSVSPNGKLVLFATHYGSNGVLSVVSTDGKVHLRLPARDGDVQEPAWGPFRG